MIKQFIVSMALLLSACSVSHEIKIPKEPCLYPFKDYDFTLCRKFRFTINHTEYMIHRGFATDLASIPRILWSIYSPTKIITIPGAVIHDYFYFCPGEMTRREADAIFYDALIYKGLPKRTAFRYWAAVRIFGRSHFNEGAICTHGDTRTENSIGHLRVAYETASRDLQRPFSEDRQRG